MQGRCEGAELRAVRQFGGAARKPWVGSGLLLQSGEGRAGFTVLDNDMGLHVHDIGPFCRRCIMSGGIVAFEQGEADASLPSASGREPSGFREVVPLRQGNGAQLR